MPNTFRALEAIYRSEGYSIRSSLNPYHYSGLRDAPFTAIYDSEGKVIATGGGLALQEIVFLDYLADGFHPKNIFVIGNAFGWSTLALGLAFQGSKIIAIDSGEEGIAADWIDLTNLLAKKHDINALVLRASSPDDVQHLVESHFNSHLDLALIDGLHTNRQQSIDFNAIEPFCAAGIILFHDVVNWNMQASFSEITQQSEMTGVILHRTPSGMGCLYSRDTAPEVVATIRLFTDENERDCRPASLKSRLFAPLRRLKQRI